MILFTLFTGTCDFGRYLGLSSPEHPIHLVELVRKWVRTADEGDRRAVVSPANELLVRRCEVVERGVLPDSNSSSWCERVVLQKEPPDSC